jgi:hypothetical protein
LGPCDTSVSKTQKHLIAFLPCPLPAFSPAQIRSNFSHNRVLVLPRSSNVVSYVSGGGVAMINVQATLHSCVFRNNSATLQAAAGIVTNSECFVSGGALQMNNANGVTRINQTIFVGNRVSSACIGSGGAVSVSAPWGDMFLGSVIFAYNSVRVYGHPYLPTVVGGGGLEVVSTVTVTRHVIEASLFVGNRLEASDVTNAGRVRGGAAYLTDCNVSVTAVVVVLVVVTIITIIIIVSSS